MDEETEILRARDVWAARVLMGLSLFFLWRTMDIPLWRGNRAGVSGAAWYNSAAIVPLSIFTALLILSVVLLVIALRAGGGRRAVSLVGLGWSTDDAFRISAIAVILFFYIAGLVPRVDFVLCSGLLITALTFGFYLGRKARMTLAALTVAIAGLYAMIANLPRSDWGTHDDDWLTLGLWAALTGVVLIKARGDAVLRATPVVALVAPVLLVCAMAFGFRQNVPNRGGLAFQQIEYHYFLTLRPLWRS